MVTVVLECPVANYPRGWTSDRYRISSSMLDLYLQEIFSAALESFFSLGWSMDFSQSSLTEADTIIELVYIRAVDNWAAFQPLPQIHRSPRHCPLAALLSQWPLSFARVSWSFSWGPNSFPGSSSAYPHWPFQASDRASHFSLRLPFAEATFHRDLKFPFIYYYCYQGSVSCLNNHP